MEREWDGPTVQDIIEDVEEQLDELDPGSAQYEELRTDLERLRPFGRTEELLIEKSKGTPPETFRHVETHMERVHAADDPAAKLNHLHNAVGVLLDEFMDR